MSRKITVTPEILIGASDKIESIMTDYQRTYIKLYSEIENMNSAWDGADNIAYISQVRGFEDDFQLMYKLMLEYAQFLRMSAKAYQSTQDGIISAASNLSNGGDPSPYIKACDIERFLFKVYGSD